MEEKIISITKEEYEQLSKSNVLLEQLKTYFINMSCRLSFDKKSLIFDYDSLEFFKFLFPDEYNCKLTEKIIELNKRQDAILKNCELASKEEWEI